MVGFVSYIYMKQKSINLFSMKKMVVWNNGVFCVTLSIDLILKIWYGRNFKN